MEFAAVTQVVSSGQAIPGSFVLYGLVLTNTAAGSTVVTATDSAGTTIKSFSLINAGTLFIQAPVIISNGMTLTVTLGSAANAVLTVHRSHQGA